MLRFPIYDACGVCSTLQDFVVYAKDPDLGTPVRECGGDTFANGFEEDVKCLQALGLSRPCAQILGVQHAEHPRKMF